MVEKLPISPSQRENAQNKTSISMLDEPQCCTRKWYFTRQEIEDHSPSRKDGIDLRKESRLRKLYCSFLQELGMTIKVPQVTIANAIMLCHQFYMRHSHAKNDWQTIATVSMFLGCKIEDTPRLRKDVVTAAYEILHKKDPSAPGRIRQKELFNKQQELLLIGERFLLATIAFDLDIQLPYKPLVAALKRLKLGTDIPQVAWNFVNDWLCTTLCLQYKPHYIAAGSVFLAAKYQQVKLPTKNGKVWWLEFDISPKLLEEVIKQMLRLLEQDKGQASIPMRGRSDQPTTAVAKPILNSPKSLVNTPIDAHRCNDGAQLKNGGIVKLTSSNSCQNLAHGDNIATSEEVLPSHTSESGNADSVIEDGDGENPPAVCDSNQNSRCEIVSVENRTSDCDQNPSCKIVSVENGAGGSSKNSTSTTVSGHNADNTVVEDVGNRPEAKDCSVGASRKNSNSIPMIDAARIREALRKRKFEKAMNRKADAVCDSNQNSRCGIVSVEYRTSDCDQNPSCKIVENGAGDSSKNSTSSSVSCHNAENIVVDDVENRPEAKDYSVGASHKSSNSKPMIDAARIREALRKRKSEKATNKKAFEVKNDDVDIETWIERRLESEIELESAASDKRQRIGL